MYKINLKYFLISVYSFISLDSLPINSSSVSSNNLLLDDVKLVNKIYKNISSIDKNANFYISKNSVGIKNSLKQDLSELKVRIANLNINQDSNSSLSFVDIKSDSQYQIDNIFYAEGNVIVSFTNSLLFADKISYDSENKIFVARGNVRFEKGNQYFECSNLLYELKNSKGFINNIYGSLNIESFYEDFNLKKAIPKKNSILSSQNLDVRELNYMNSTNIGLDNDFEKGKKFNITSLDFEVPQITKWRFKAKKILINSETFSSERIVFTNDVFNRPQFVLESNNFSGEIVDNKLKLISKNTWINLEDRFKLPIGRRSIFDSEPISKWGLGSDYGEKDGFFISRSFDSIKLSDYFKLRFTPSVLIQRAIMGKTRSFREDGSSIFANKIRNDTSTSDLFALNTDLEGEINFWNINLNSKLNSFNPDRLDESTRAKLTISRSFDLLKNENINDKSIKQDLSEDYSEEMVFNNFIDLKISSAYRQTINKGFDGEADIYFANSIGLANRKSWLKNGVNTNFEIIYDLGEFNSKKRSEKELVKLFRNVLASRFSYSFPLWEKKSINNQIDETYKYYPTVIKEGIQWKSSINSGLFFYSDGSKQEVVTINTGPEITLGSFRTKYLDYTKLGIKGTYVVKNGQSPFSFDNFNETERLNLNLQQQIFGPLVFNYESYLNLENGKFSEPKYGLNISRRAYSLGGYYYPESEVIGFRFKIFNFNYSGLSPKF